MLNHRDLRNLSWHPLRDVGRSENYALGLEGYDAHGQIRYVMACGHRSVPGHTWCERGCRTAPNYRGGPVRMHPGTSTAARAYGKYFDRRGIPFGARKVA